MLVPLPGSVHSLRRWHESPRPAAGGCLRLPPGPGRGLGVQSQPCFTQWISPGPSVRIKSGPRPMPHDSDGPVLRHGAARAPGPPSPTHSRDGPGDRTAWVPDSALAAAVGPISRIRNWSPQPIHLMTAVGRWAQQDFKFACGRAWKHLRIIIHLKRQNNCNRQHEMSYYATSW